MTTWPQRFRVEGTDEWGRVKIEYITLTPPLYFWLGKDAYPEPKRISSIDVTQRIGSDATGG